MKILFLSALYPPWRPGGAEVVAENLAAGLARLGHEVVVLTLAPAGAPTHEIIDGVRIIRVPLANLYWNLESSSKAHWIRALWHLLDIYNQPMANRVKEVVRAERPDLVAMHNIPGFSVSAYGALRDCGIPIVQILHDYYFLCPYSTMYCRDTRCQSPCLKCRLFRLPHRTLSNSVSAVIGVSRFVLEQATRAGLFRNAAKHRIINARCMPPPVRQTTRTGSTVVFGYIGTLSRHKGLETLIAAFEKMTTRNVELLIAGTGEADYVARLQFLTNSPRLHLVGRQDAAEFFSRIDVCVIPSLWHEPLSLVAIESSSVGVPVIAARVGGLPEVVTHGDNGLLYDPDSPAELTNCLDLLASNGELRQQLGRQSPAAVAHLTDIGRWVRHYEELFLDLVERRSSPLRPDAAK